jgi:predicted nucleotide-binding protein
VSSSIARAKPLAGSVRSAQTLAITQTVELHVNKDQVLAILTGKGFVLDSEKALPYGVQVRFTNGSLVSIFDSGAVTPQGKDTELVKELLGLSPGKQGAAAAAPAKAHVNNKVFVVYGHDEQARARLDAMLRRWGLEPLILDQLPSEGQTIIEKLEKYTGEAKFGVVLATPDDEGYRRNHPDEKALRARQNVVLELGMLLSTLGRSKVAILLHQQEHMERPSDIQGLIYIPFKDNLEKDAGLLLAKEMTAAGYQLDVAKI